jgi:hypothetical protein
MSWFCQRLSVFRHRSAADLQRVWHTVAPGRGRGLQTVDYSGRRPPAFRHGQARLSVGVVNLVGLVISLAVWKIPQWQAASWEGPLAANDTVKLRNDARATLIQGFGGAALLIGLYFTLRNLQIAQEG